MLPTLANAFFLLRRPKTSHANHKDHEEVKVEIVLFEIRYKLLFFKLNIFIFISK